MITKVINVTCQVTKLVAVLAVVIVQQHFSHSLLHVCLISSSLNLCQWQYSLDEIYNLIMLAHLGIDQGTWLVLFKLTHFKSQETKFNE